MNIFEQASRQALRFQSERGLLSVEQLWQLPLQAKNNFSLDAIAIETNRSLKALAEESFVAQGSNPAKTVLELQLEILKHIIAAKQAENADARAAADRKAEKQRLLEILDRKQGQELESLSADDLRARIAALG
jgi:hypothetical protein